MSTLSKQNGAQHGYYSGSALSFLLDKKGVNYGGAIFWTRRIHNLTAPCVIWKSSSLATSVLVAGLGEVYLYSVYCITRNGIGANQDCFGENWTGQYGPAQLGLNQDTIIDGAARWEMNAPIEEQETNGRCKPAGEFQYNKCTVQEALQTKMPSRATP